MNQYESIKQQLATMIQDIANKEKGNLSLESKIHMKKVKNELGEIRRKLIVLQFDVEDIY
jgi:hypothetical protein